MKQFTFLAMAILIVLAALIAAPPPAQAFSPDAWGSKLLGTAGDTILLAFGIECLKAGSQEVTRWRERYVVGVILTAPGGCAANWILRGASTAGDWVTTVIPVTTDHLAKPRTWEGTDPLWSIPK